MTYFFVGGCQRTGTTLLQSVLCTDETTNPLIYESFLLLHLVEAYAKGKPHYEVRGKDYFADAEAFRAFHRQWVTAFLETTRNRYAPAANLVLKEISLSKLFPLLHELVPGAKFLLLVRDPRDTIASLVKVGERMGAAGRQNVFDRQDMSRLAEYYKSFYRPCLKIQDPKFRRNLMIVKYENLVANTETELDRIRNFTGLELKDFRANQAWKRSRVDFEELKAWDLHRPWDSDLWGKKLSPTRVGSYAEVLTDDEVRTLARECADVFHVFGYDDAGQAEDKDVGATAAEREKQTVPGE